ncbi:hypothetical protein GCM10028778_07500 [Barrientosiimonas marina]|uniref:GW dipeptide domain-containing protein n=1 Tax=Lentibacillus kimchii TaxID=1542911 RepID=A0ABW2UY69_9BACI
MRKLSIVLAVCLLCSTVAPSSVFAANTDAQAESDQPEAAAAAENNQPVSSDEQTAEQDESAADADKSDKQPSADTDSNDQADDDQAREADTEDSPSSNQTSSSDHEMTDPEAEQQKTDEGQSADDEEAQQPETDDDTDVTAEQPSPKPSDPEQASISAQSVTNVTTSPASKLGHLHAGASIYEQAGKASTAFSSDDYLDAVYYIKEQAEAGNELYYLISEQASSTRGVIGWVKASDISTHVHKAKDRKSKTVAFTGSGNAYAKAWGGSEDHIYDLSNFKGHVFRVHKTETVGHNTWYRGDFKGERIWVHENYVTKLNESPTSKLGHLRNGSMIYGSEASFSGEDYKDAVYYIKKQAKSKSGDKRYYLISEQASSTRGVIGWVKASDMSTHVHEAKDRKPKTVAFTGSGNAYAKAWGGSKDHIYDLSNFKGHVFHVHKTETVGHNTWYRGDFNGERIWVHENYVTKLNESPTSRLGHLRSGSMIYGSEASFSGDDYDNAVYYIKRQAQAGSRTYYLISEKPSSTRGVIGWVKASDMSTHVHKAKDRKRKSFFITKPGNAYAKAWGGPRDKVYDLSNYKGDIFQVHKTETVGQNTWYRGDFKGERIWIHEAYVAHENKSQYDMTLNDMVDKQMEKTNKTDEGTSSGFESASHDDVAYYMDPDNFEGNFRGSLQFVELTQSAKIDVSEVNDSILKNKGVLAGQAQQFVKAGSEHDVNEVYLMSHAILETGNGASDLATGIEVGLDEDDDPQLVTSDNKDDLTAIKTVHNLFGVKAHDDSAVESGAKYAYKQGWFSIDKAIMGGADYIDHGYIDSGQSTLYQMRWNPAYADNHDHPSFHQYATDIGWAYKQTRYMSRIYNLLDNYRLMYNVPQYK